MIKVDPVGFAVAVGAILIGAVVGIREYAHLQQNESQLCPLLQQAYESAEGMSPGWYGRTANTLIEECQYGDTQPKDFRL